MNGPGVASTKRYHRPGQPRVSVIIPAYNASATVCTAVDSALGQTFTNHEVIVVDDGSTDATRSRLDGYGSRIRYVYQQNQERSAARNNGIRHARGDLLAFLDADDYWAPHKLEKQVTLLDAHPDLGLVFSWAAAFDASIVLPPPKPTITSALDRAT